MARSTASIVEELREAADALTAYRRQLEMVPLPDRPVLPAPAAVVQGSDPPAPAARLQATRPRLPRPPTSKLPVGSSPVDGGEVLAMPQPEWLFQHLTVSGVAEEIARFRAAAVGPGIIPWAADFDQLEEDLFLMLMGEGAHPRELSAVGAHVLAERVRQMTERRQGQAERTPWSVQFDLHALLPVPGAILNLGADHPQARQWLWTHWGTTRPLRDVAAVQAGRAEPDPAGPFFRLVFWSADWTPWAAFHRLGAEWSALTFRVRPFYDVD